MNASAQVRLRALLPLAAAVMSACTAINPKPDVAEATQALRRGPESGPQRSITNFSDALRCMDTTCAIFPCWWRTSPIRPAR